jgi:hypothetical protein
MSEDRQYRVAHDAPARLKSMEKRPPKVFVFDYTLTGQLVITADSAEDAYRLAIMVSKEDLGAEADLIMEDPDEMGAVQ